MRAGCPRRSASVVVRSDPPCSKMIRCPAATYCAISLTMRSVATPAPPPIFTTSVIAKFPSISWLRRVQAGKGQAQRLVPAVHTIERLHRVSGCPLHQVIESRHHHYPALRFVKLEANIAVVAACQNLRLRIAIDATALFDQANERLVPVRFAVQPPQGALVHCLLHKHMGRYQYTAYQFDRRSRKGYGLAHLPCDLSQFLHQFGAVAMPCRLK